MIFFEILAAILDFAFFSFATAYIFGDFLQVIPYCIPEKFSSVCFFSEEKSKMTGLYDDFTASNGWLDRFKARHNIKCSILSGESGDVNEEVVEDLATYARAMTTKTFLTVTRRDCFSGRYQVNR